MTPACQLEFEALAAGDGLVLSPAEKLPWLNQRGHLGVSTGADVSALARIFDALDGDPVLLGAKRATPIPGDLEHLGTGTFVEIDEVQHFTTHRALTLSLYPEDAPLGFDRDEYLMLCERWSPKANRAFAHKAAVGFGPGGRPRQRAYNDALRDLLVPSMGRPGVIRVPVPDRDVLGAYAKVRDRLHAALSAVSILRISRRSRTIGPATHSKERADGAGSYPAEAAGFDGEMSQHARTGAS